jgi:hypothetical protein
MAALYAGLPGLSHGTGRRNYAGPATWLTGTSTRGIRLVRRVGAGKAKVAAVSPGEPPREPEGIILDTNS